MKEAVAVTQETSVSMAAHHLCLLLNGMGIPTTLQRQTFLLRTLSVLLPSWKWTLVTCQYADGRAEIELQVVSREPAPEQSSATSHPSSAEN